MHMILQRIFIISLNKDTNNIFDLEGCKKFFETNINPITKRKITDKKRI